VAAGSEVRPPPGALRRGCDPPRPQRGDHDVSLPALRSAWHRGRRRGRRPRRRARLPTTPQRRIRASPPGRRPGGPEGPPGSGRTPHPAGRRRARERVVARRRTALGRRLNGVGRSPTALRRGGELAATRRQHRPTATQRRRQRCGSLGCPVRRHQPSAGARRRWNRLGRRTRSRCLAARRELERGSNSGPRDHIWQRRGGNTWRRCGGNARGRDVRSQRRCRGLGGGRWRVCGHPVGHPGCRLDAPWGFGRL
jgi:hypothetical protein